MIIYNQDYKVSWQVVNISCSLLYPMDNFKPMELHSWTLGSIRGLVTCLVTLLVFQNIDCYNIER